MNNLRKKKLIRHAKQCSSVYYYVLLFQKEKHAYNTLRSSLLINQAHL